MEAGSQARNSRVDRPRWNCQRDICAGARGSGPGGQRGPGGAHVKISEASRRDGT